MRFRLKDQPLWVQIWFTSGIILALIFFLFAVLLPLVLKRSFTNEIYTRLEDSQEYALQNREAKWPYPGPYPPGPGPGPDPIFKRDDRLSHFRVVRHLYFHPKEEMPIRELTPEFIKQMKEDALSQKEGIKRYVGELKGTKILYVIRKVDQNGEEVFLISYLWERYRDNLVKITVSGLLVSIVVVLLLSWSVSFILARNLTEPLTNLEQRVKEIAQRKWDQPVILDRGDEIGSLGRTIEWMRCQLIEQNKNQQAFLQKVSHELKTPVMIIRSYTESILDGIYPAENLENSLREIEEETERLEKRVRSLLHLSKMEYLATHGLEKSQFYITELIEQLVERFSWRRTELEWDLKLADLQIYADKEKLTVALENILDNQLRYSENKVQIELNGTRLRIWNDGPPIGEKLLHSLFTRFKKGADGEFGLGLAIVKMIIDLHHWQIWVANEDGGVAFYIQLN